MEEPPDRVVLITGATGGLGRVAARTFRDDGARLVLKGTNEDRLRALAADLELDEDAWTPLLVDLRDRDAGRAALSDAEERHGRIDVVLHIGTDRQDGALCDRQGR